MGEVMGEVLKTPADWCLVEGVEILDYDGWRGAAGRPITDLVSLAEFRDRLATCTQRQIPANRPDAPTTLQRWPGGPDRRLKSCVENWPEAESCEYNPACCRFPKSCSADSYSLEFITEDHLEPVQEAPAGEHHVGTLDLSGEGNRAEVASPISDEAIAEIAGRMFDGDLVRQPQRVQDRVWRDAHAALEAAYPAIREQVAEEIAVGIEEALMGLLSGLEARSAAVAIARAIGRRGVETTSPGRAVGADLTAGANADPSNPPESRALSKRLPGVEG